MTKRGMGSVVAYDDIYDTETKQTVRITFTIAKGQKPCYEIMKRKWFKFSINENGERGLSPSKWRKTEDKDVAIIVMMMPIYTKDQCIRVNEVLQKPFPFDKKDPEYDLLREYLSNWFSCESVPEDTQVICLSLMPVLPVKLLQYFGYQI